MTLATFCGLSLLAITDDVKSMKSRFEDAKPFSVVKGLRCVVAFPRFRPRLAEAVAVDTAAMPTRLIGSQTASNSSSLPDGFWRELDRAEAERIRRLR